MTDLATAPKLKRVRAFDDPHDGQAAEILAAADTGREAVMVPAHEVFSGGGGIHGIMQQQPKSAV
jgi:agmatine deiminase